MSCEVDPNELGHHLLVHEVLGVTAGGGGGGDLTITDGYPVYTDPTRSDKILTIARNTFEAGDKGRSRNTYLFTADSVNTLGTGIRMARRGTITMVAVQNSQVNTFDLQIRRNSNPTSLLTLSVVTGVGAHNSAADVDFNQGDLLQFYIDGTARDVHAWIEVAWRVS